ncbi:MAG TPA: zf-TFIIB domain-containing protein [Acidimicrobiales bacterium]
MKCPNCEVNLLMTDRQGVEIDYCPECRGVWLDRGELDKIIERSHAELVAGSVGAVAPSAPPRSEERDRRSDDRDRDRYRDDDRHRDQGKPKKKRKSFLEDIFEF